MPEAGHAPRRAKLFRNNRNQAVRIPVDMELPGTEVLISRDGDRLIVEPVHRMGLIALLDSWGPLHEEFPEIDDPPLPPEDIF